MAVLSGLGGKVLVGSTAVAEVLTWSFNPTSANPSWASSSTSGYKKRVAGVKDGSGSFDFKYDAADRIHATVDEGDSVTLKLYLDATDYITVPALIDDISFDVNVNDPDVVGGTINFSTNGAWTYPT